MPILFYLPFIIATGMLSALAETMGAPKGEPEMQKVPVKKD